jgi:hypothetical protein
VHLVSREKLNHRGTVATIIGLPLAILLAWVVQATAEGDTIRVHSSNQQGGITANTVNITTPPGQLNGASVHPDREMFAINLQSMTNVLQDLQESYDQCKKIGTVEQCRSILHGIETNTALRNKSCKDNQIPRGQYGCP